MCEENAKHSSIQVCPIFFKFIFGQKSSVNCNLNKFHLTSFMNRFVCQCLTGTEE